MAATTVNKTLETLKAMFAEIQDLRSVQGLLGWDLEVMMPEHGAELRSHQMATLAKLSHQKMTDPKVGEWLAELEAAQADLSAIDQAMLRQARRDYEKATKIPEALLEKMVRVTSEAHQVWVQARAEKNFKRFAPILSQIIDLNRQMADVVGYEGSPYNALLDDYEPGLTVTQLDPLFAALKSDLVQLLQKIQASKVKPNTDFLYKPAYDSQKQMEFSKIVLAEMGFDFNAGRLDLAAHPFSSGAGYSDVRLTTRINEHDLFSALSSSMHEGGHGMYEQGIDPALSRTLLAEGTSLGIHESQSRMWENIVGRGASFWQHYYPKLQAHFSPQLDTITPAQFILAVNDVRPSLIRVEADEVTYNLHIIIRYEIERDIIEGRLQVDDIPAAWNQKYQDYLGITPPDDSEGCLQDIHWSHGSFGYFPTYSLGNLYSAQFYRQAQKEIPDLEAQIAKGNLLILKQWLNEKIHKVGRSEWPSEIVQRVCGEALNPAYFTQYLNDKYSKLYQL